MSLSDPRVFATFHDDGSADLTLSVADDDYKFSVSAQNNHAVVTYEETLTWRGEIRVSEPREDVWRLLMQSDEMTRFLEEAGVQRVKRERQP